MGCPKNPKKFLGLVPYQGAHRYKYVVAYWGFEKFQMIGTCEACGSGYHSFGIDFDQMVAMGFDPDFIRDMKYDRYYKSEEEWRIKKELEAKEAQ